MGPQTKAPQAKALCGFILSSGNPAAQSTPTTGKPSRDATGAPQERFHKFQ